MSDNDKIRLILQLIKGNSRVLQKLLKYFNGVTISIFFSILPSLVEPVIFCLNLNDALLLSTTEQLAIASLASKQGLFL